MRPSASDGNFRITALCLLAIARTAAGNSETISGIQSTCPARTINYITQTLPQQCLTSSWASKPTAQTTSRDTFSNGVEASTSVLTVNDLTPSYTDSSGTVTTSSESPNAADNVPSTTSKPTAAQTVTPTERAEGAGLSEDPNQGNDLDSPLDNSKFLSFEEWKHQNLAKAGQSAESLGKRQEGTGSEQRRRPVGINNALDTFGEDNEIDIDFSGFVNAGGMNEAVPIPSPMPISTSTAETGAPKENVEDLSNTYQRNKDAGKTCKERSNYASFDCAATVLKTNLECKSATSVLVESKDSYMLNVCSAQNKFFIVELCDDILVDTIVLANFEYFSSMFRTFRVSVSDRYPVKMDKWKELGVFEAHNSRAIQAFLIENPLIWARYLRVELLTHFGAEYYCPVSLLRVHGTTMMEEFNHEVKGLRSEDDAEDEVEDIKDEASVQLSDTAPTEEAVNHMLEATESAESATKLTATPAEAAHDSVSSKATSLNVEAPLMTTKGSTPYRPSIARELEDILLCRNEHAGRCSHVHEVTDSKGTSSLSPSISHEEAEPTTSEHWSTRETGEIDTPENTQGTSTHISVPPVDSTSSSSRPSHSSIDPNGTDLSPKSSPAVATNNTTDSTEVNSITRVVSSVARSAKDVSLLSRSTSATQPFAANSTSTERRSTQELSSSPSSPTLSPSSSSAVNSPATSVKAPASSIQPPPANPSTQESFFKLVHKRLQQLEANSTLSLQYIEEQSRILRDAFSSVEKRQLSKTSTFLETLNMTVLTELRDFRMQYDQIWQSTVLELSSQREQSAKQVSVLSARMTFLADEVVFQKRIAMVQFMLILLCLGLIVFSRSGRASTHLELPPLVHNAIKRSSANFARYTHFETPPASPSPSRPPSEGLSSRFGLFHRKSHRRTRSDELDANGGIQSPVIAYSPPSPVSQISRDDREASPSGPSADELDHLNFN